MKKQKIILPTNFLISLHCEDIMMAYLCINLLQITWGENSLCVLNEIRVVIGFFHWPTVSSQMKN